MRLIISLSVVACLLNAVRAIPHGWIRSHKPAENSSIPVTFPIVQSNLELLEKLFWEVSDPSSSLYGNYLTYEQIGELVANPKATAQTVQFLKAVGVPQDRITVNEHGTFVHASLPLHTAEALLASEFAYYTHPDALGKFILKTESASVPDALKSFVTHIPHVSYFPDVNAKVGITADATSGTSNYVSPQKLMSYYGIDTVRVQHGATQALFEALGQDFDNTDLNSFQRYFKLPIQNVTQVIGRDTPSDCFTTKGGQDCGEANLDVQYMMGVAENAYTVYWSIDQSAQDPFVTWVEQASNAKNPPMVVSISYGGYESSTSDMNLFNTEAMKLGLRGVSIIVSSGDDGAANSAARSTASYCGYYASFPASSPYVTAVGATQGPESGKAEIACSSQTGGVVTSGGGFSKVYAQPGYQKNHVARYFQTARSENRSPVAGFNANGRGYPDVSLLGYNYVVVIGGKFVLVSGTSASAPVFGALVTLINDARIAQGKRSLGFLNQALYSLDSNVWHDITVGNNKCTANPNICCNQGFTVVAGWDPVTGLGTPKFQLLKNALLQK
eukprot:TRINITY_DN2489_c0_g1_i1.p1 TRINITY_DN2489_c0_g1~~TRINITY_DN2489_c0_g1_i1.p1  ORF type:complete len:558 (-),score=141.00 TRINITY_DN2489_c0_g1_i1:36-1709(-)